MKTSTITLTISHEGDLPKGLLAAIEAKAYGFTMNHGVACGEVVAREATQQPTLSGWSIRKSDDGSGLIVWKDGLGGYLSRKDDPQIASSILAHLAADIESCAAQIVLRLPVKEMRDE